jgi:hypothetical protein
MDRAGDRTGDDDFLALGHVSSEGRFVGFLPERKLDRRVTL